MNYKKTNNTREVEFIMKSTTKLKGHSRGKWRRRRV